MRKRVLKKIHLIFNIVLLAALIVINIYNKSPESLTGKVKDLFGKFTNSSLSNTAKAEDIEDIPQWDGETEYVIVNNNKPDFSQTDIERGALDTWLDLSDLDLLSRTGPSYACLNESMTPDDERGEIGHIKPSGWHQAKYPGVIEENPAMVVNRGHQIAFCLSGLNDEERNLFTETRQANLCQEEFELYTLHYIKQHPDNHVLYRATPIFEGTNLMASGILLEAYSIEDNGKGIEFCVYIYNVQKYVVFDYATGESRLTEEGKARIKE